MEGGEKGRKGGKKARWECRREEDGGTGCEGRKEAGRETQELGMEQRWKARRDGAGNGVREQLKR